MSALSDLLDTLDAQAPAHQRHLWLLQCLTWLRGQHESPQAVVQRVRLMLDAFDVQPELKDRFRAWLDHVLETLDVTALLADHGFAMRSSFLSELATRLRRRWLPHSPDTHNATELLHLLEVGSFDAAWLQALDADTLARLARLVADDAAPAAAHPVSHWQQDLLLAMRFCISHVQAAGFSSDLRQRMAPETLQTKPFLALADDMSHLERMVAAHGPHDPRSEQAGEQLRTHMDECRVALVSVYSHLETHGISLNLVFALRQVRERLIRVRDLLDSLIARDAHAPTVRVLARLAHATNEGRSIRSLVNANLSMLAVRVTERSAETGEHYITRNAPEYTGMLRKAAGGGALTAFTTWFKFLVAALGLSAFWTGVGSGVVYAVSFVVIQLLHFTLATKQPAMTAPALAAKLKDLDTPERVSEFVDEVTHLVRSQVAAVLGNVGLVIPAVLALSYLIAAVHGAPMLDRPKADAVFHNLHLLNPTTLLYAAFTGILLFASSLVAGATENAFVLHRMDSALRYNPRIGRWLGAARAQRLADWLRLNISALAGNVFLGLMLGIVPVVLSFVALPIDVRHVTLSAGQLAAAAAAYGADAWTHAPLWWSAAAIPFIGLCNVLVSFYLAFRLALRARGISVSDRSRLRRAVLQRLRAAPLSFLLPQRGVA